MDKINAQARERLLEIQARQRGKTENLVAALTGVIEAVRAEKTAPEKLQGIERVFTEHGGIGQVQADRETLQTWSNNNYFPLTPPYKRCRYLLFRLAGALQFVSTTQDRS